MLPKLGLALLESLIVMQERGTARGLGCKSIVQDLLSDG